VTPAVLEARGLHFGYEPGRPVLTGADLALRAGRRTAVLGPNGGGKTTLFRLLAGALAPDAGEVLLDGTPVRRTRQVAEHRFVPGAASPTREKHERIDSAWLE